MCPQRKTFICRPKCTRKSDELVEFGGKYAHFRSGLIRADNCERNGKPRTTSAPGKKKRVEGAVFGNREISHRTPKRLESVTWNVYQNHSGLSPQGVCTLGAADTIQKLDDHRCKDGWFSFIRVMKFSTRQFLWRFPMGDFGTSVIQSWSSTERLLSAFC
jgi:hypothetical protein